jgi:pimeloyl-ACP methyl ester carboxylesterase
MSVILNHQRFENAGAPAVVILHGLLGSGRNWSTVGKALQANYDVHILDLRNHGQSPHAESMRWVELVEDVAAYFEQAGLQKVILIGHSLGGKIAMRIACEHAERISHLVVVDIAARAYPPYHDAEFRAMRRMAVGELLNRKEAEELLAVDVPNWAMRQFLLTNLVRDAKTGAFKWQINLEALHASLPHIRENSLRAGDLYEGPSFLIRGEQSDFVSDADVEALGQWFSNIKSVNLKGVGHNVHVEDRNGFLDALLGWLRAN